MPVVGRADLFLLPGHVRLSEYEVTLGIAQELSGSIHTLRNLPGAFPFFIAKVAEKYNAEFVLVDMNPSLGALNQNFLMTSDYFVVPTSPDYFCKMAIESLATIMPRWMDWAKRAHESEVLRSAAYSFPEPKLKFMGTIVQKYRPRLGGATVGFQKWIDEINERVVNRLYPALLAKGLTFSDQAYTEASVGASQSFCLAQVPDFNTLVATSQTHRTPVFALTDDMFGHVGTVLAQDREKRNDFAGIFNTLSDRVVTLSRHV